MVNPIDNGYGGFFKGFFISLADHQLTEANSALAASYTALSLTDESTRLSPFVPSFTSTITPGEPVNETGTGGRIRKLYNNMDSFMFSFTVSSPELAKKFINEYDGKNVFVWLVTSKNTVQNVKSSTAETYGGFRLQCFVSYTVQTDTTDCKVNFEFTGDYNKQFTQHGHITQLSFVPEIDLLP